MDTADIMFLVFRCERPWQVVHINLENGEKVDANVVLLYSRKIDKTHLENMLADKLKDGRYQYLGNAVNQELRWDNIYHNGVWKPY